MTSKTRPLLLFFFILCSHVAPAQQKNLLPAQKIVAERLPNLTMPRKTQAATCLNGEIVLFGGHTTGFLPTATAEYYDGKEWHLIEMPYIHNHALGLPLSSGKYLLSGGHEKSLGIGQTFTVETYDPKTHTFSDFGCLELKRCFSAGTELDSGRVLIAGNWYEKDCMEIWDGSRNNHKAKEVSFTRSTPYVLRTAKDNAIVCGYLDEHGEILEKYYVVDQLKGDSYEEPFLKTWHPLCDQSDYRSEVGFIGEGKNGHFTYIIPVSNDSLQTTLALVENGRFSLLKTDFPIPTTWEGKHLTFYSRFIADRKRSKGYLVGHDNDSRIIVLCADYSEALKGGEAKLTFFYTDSLNDAIFSTAPVVDDEGNIILAGGLEKPLNNFEPVSTVLKLSLAKTDETDAALSWKSIGWTITGLLVLLLLFFVIRFLLKRKEARFSEDKSLEDDSYLRLDPKVEMERIENYMNKQSVYLNPKLKISDLSRELKLSGRTISNILKVNGFRSFPEYLKAKRIDHACQLLAEHPEKKIRHIYTEAGFASQSTFYSAFTYRTGMTPKEWVTAKQLPNEE